MCEEICRQDSLGVLNLELYQGKVRLSFLIQDNLNYFLKTTEKLNKKFKKKNLKKEITSSKEIMS